MPDERFIKRDYIKTPQLVQTGAHLPSIPIQLSNGQLDVDGLRRLLDAIVQAINKLGGTDGVSGTYDLTTTPNVIFKDGKLISIE